MLFPEETLTRQWWTATTLDKYLDAIWLAKGQKRSNAVHSERTYHHVRPWPATAEALPYRLTSFGLDVISPLLYDYYQRNHSWKEVFPMLWNWLPFSKKRSFQWIEGQRTLICLQKGRARRLLHASTTWSCLTFSWFGNDAFYLFCALT